MSMLIVNLLTILGSSLGVQTPAEGLPLRSTVPLMRMCHGMYEGELKAAVPVPMSVLIREGYVLIRLGEETAGDVWEAHLLHTQYEDPAEARTYLHLSPLPDSSEHDIPSEVLESRIWCPSYSSDTLRGELFGARLELTRGARRREEGGLVEEGREACETVEMDDEDFDCTFYENFEFPPPLFFEESDSEVEEAQGEKRNFGQPGALSAKRRRVELQDKREETERQEDVEMEGRDSRNWAPGVSRW